MSTARKLRTELAAYLEPYGLSVEASGTEGSGLKSTPGMRTRGVAVFDGDRLLGQYGLDRPESVLAAVKALHKLRPDVPLLVAPKSPRASRSRKALEPTAPMPPRPVAELEALFEEPTDEGPAAYVEQVAEDDEGVHAHTRRDNPALPAASAPRPTTQAPPWDAVAAAARVAREREAVTVTAPDGFDASPPAVGRAQVPGAGQSPGTLLGCQLIARVRRRGELEGEVLPPLVDAADDGLRRGLPTWLVRDGEGHLAVLVTNGEPVAA